MTKPITDDQIRKLGARLVSEGKYCAAMWCDYALVSDSRRYDIPRGCDRETARQRCAEAINAQEGK